MAENEQFEIPVLIKHKGTPDGSISGVWGFRNVFSKLYQTILRHPFILAVVAIFKAGSVSISAWRAQEKAINSLNQSLVKQGIYSRALSHQYQETALAIQKQTVFSDQAVLAAQASMQSYLGDTKISKELLMVVADFAQANGMDLEQAGSLIAKTIGTATNGLARYGVELEEGLTKAQKMTAVMGILDGRFHGQAEAATKGLGSIDQMANALNTVVERFGKSLAPFVSMFAIQLAQTAAAIISSPAVNYVFSEALEHSLVIGSFFKMAFTTIAQVIVDHTQVVFLSIYGQFTGRTKEFSEHIERLTSRTLDIPKQQWREFLAERQAIYAARKLYEDSFQRNYLEQYARGKTERFEAVKATSDKIQGFTAARSTKEISELLARLSLKDDARIKILNEEIANEQDITRKLELELKKRKIITDRIEQKAQEHERRISLFSYLDNKARLALTKDGLSSLMELKNSKYGPQVLIGKAAAIASIGVNTSISIPLAIEAFAAIPPPAGEALGTAFSSFLMAYAAEQIANIAGVTIDNPGRIGEIPFNLETALQKLWGMMGDNARLSQIIGRAVFSKAADISDSVGDAIAGALGSWNDFGKVVGGYINLVGDAMAAQYRIASFIYDKVYGAIADVVENVSAFVASIVADAISAIGNAIADAADAVFGWLFAEGGVVSTAGGQPSVTPLKNSGIDLGTEITVTIEGGLVPSREEAKRLAKIVYSEMRR